MHLSDTFIQLLHWMFTFDHVFPGIWTYDLGVASVMLFAHCYEHIKNNVTICLQIGQLLDIRTKIFFLNKSHPPQSCIYLIKYTV